MQLPLRGVFGRILGNAHWLLAWSVPLCCGVVAQFTVPTPRSIAASPPLPALAFEQYLIDYGAVIPTEEVRTHFGFVNNSERLVTIDRLDSSCGCLQPQLAAGSQQLDPGERGEFLLRVQTANQSVGPKEYSVTVHYRDPEPQQTTVRFRVTLPDNQVVVRPRAVMIYLTDDSPMLQSAEVVDRRKRKLEITRIESHPPELAEVTHVATEDDDEGHRHYRLQVSVPADLPQGNHRGTVWIHTNDPAYQRLRLPLALQKGKLPSPGATAVMPRPRR